MRHDSIVLYFDAATIREHFAETDEDLSDLPDTLLQQAGEVIVNRPGDHFYEALDDMYRRALHLARNPD